jgi:hypothetical protein
MLIPIEFLNSIAFESYLCQCAMAGISDCVDIFVPFRWIHDFICVLYPSIPYPWLISFFPDETVAAFPVTRSAAHHAHPVSNSTPETPTGICPINEFAEMLLIDLFKSRHSKSRSPARCQSANPKLGDAGLSSRGN